MLKQARELLKHEEIDKAIESKRADIEKCATDILANIPKKYKNLGKFWYKGLHYMFFFLLLIPVFIYRRKCKAFRKWMAENGDYNKIYKVAFEGIKDVKFEKVHQETSTNDLLTYRNLEIPKHAMISHSTDILQFTLLDKYDVKMRSGMAYWYRDQILNTGTLANIRGPKALIGHRPVTEGGIKTSKQKYTMTTGYIEIKTPGLLPKFEYSLFHKNALLKKGDEMEDPQFNKKFQFESNDRVQSRIMYTPLTLERTVAHKENVKLKWWKIEKTADKIIIRFEPKKWNDAAIVMNPKYNNPKKFADYSIKELKKSFYLFYELTGFVMLQILL